LGEGYKTTSTSSVDIADENLVGKHVAMDFVSFDNVKFELKWQNHHALNTISF